MRTKKRRRQEWNLSFASMSDIAFLLIIFFAVAGKFTKNVEQDVTIPDAGEGEKTTPRELMLVVTKEGEYYLNGSHITEADALAEELTSVVVEDGSREEQTVTLYADRDADYGKVTVAIDAIDKAGAYLEIAVRDSK